MFLILGIYILWISMNFSQILLTSYFLLSYQLSWIETFFVIYYFIIFPFF